MNDDIWLSTKYIRQQLSWQKLAAEQPCPSSRYGMPFAASIEVQIMPLAVPIYSLTMLGKPLIRSNLSIFATVIVSWRDLCYHVKLTGTESVWAVSLPETPERDGPCWPLKLRWMGTQRVQMKEIIPSLVRRAGRSGTRDFYPAVASLVSPVQSRSFLTVH
jgi:hypothetical protein